MEYYFRFRLSPRNGTGCTAGTVTDHGPVLGGEVEDYKLTFAPLAVDLASFVGSVAEDSVLVSWETVWELGNQGFNLYRSTSLTGPRTQLNGALIPSLVPGGAQGAARLDRQLYLSPARRTTTGWST